MKRVALIVFKRSIGDNGRLNPNNYNIWTMTNEQVGWHFCIMELTFIQNLK